MSSLQTFRRAAPPVPRPSQWPQIYFGILSTSLGTLLLELTLTRIFSVVYYYHFAFLAISIALFGLGAGGVFSYAVSNWPGPIFRKVGILAASNAIGCVLCLWYLLTQTGELHTAQLAIAYFVTAVPFFFSGTILSLIISETLERVNKTYFFDLLGAATGCLVLVPLLHWIGAPSTVLVAAILFSVSSAIWFHLNASPRGRAGSVMIGILLVALIAVNNKHPLLDVRYAKGQRLTDEEFVRWNALSRIALKPEPGSEMKSIVIDADAATGVARFDFEHLSERERNDLAFSGAGVPYLLRPAAKTLVIGPGGGWDVSRALASGSKQITGVEINPIIADVIMREKFPQYSNRLYFRPEVKIVVEDGRAFVRRSSERYQVIQATLVDTWASTAAGAFALSENNLYTTNAFYDYLSHLTPDGVLAFTRWGFDPPRESLRVVALARAALEQLGERNAANHVAVIREDAQKLRGWGTRDTILVSRRPFTPADLATFDSLPGRSSMQVVYRPGTISASAFRDLLLAANINRFYQNYPFDVRPVSDDRPFFFYTVQPRDLWKFVLSASRATADFKVNSALPVLFALVGISLLATAVIVCLPPLILKQQVPRSRESLITLMFFLCIGAGYILVQVSLIQKFVLFLGHPTYALTVVIFSMLLSSGMGSFFSKHLIQSQVSRLTLTLVLIAAAVSVLSLLVTPVADNGVTLPFAWKVLITVGLIAPAGFLMGMPFPTGLSLLKTVMPSVVRWAWAVNAAASVLGSAAAMFLAIYFGLSMTLRLGGLCYLGALLSLLLSPLGGKAPTANEIWPESRRERVA